MIDFDKLAQAAESRGDSTPAGQVPRPAPLTFPPSQYPDPFKPRLRTFMSRSGLGEGSKVCPFCGIEHDSKSRYCDDRCAQLDNI